MAPVQTLTTRSRPRFSRSPLCISAWFLPALFLFSSRPCLSRFLARPRDVGKVGLASLAASSEWAALLDVDITASEDDIAPLLPVMTEDSFAPLEANIKGVHFRLHEPTVNFWQWGPGVTQAVSNSATEPLKITAVGSVLFLHACAHVSTDFFGQLPEESAMAREALRRGLMVFAADAFPVNGCWHPHIDGPLLDLAVREVLWKYGLDEKPFYGVGISSGGVMLDVLVSQYSFVFSGVQYQVSPGGALDGGPGLFATHAHPRTVFIYMKKDPYAPPKTIRAAQKALLGKKTPVRVWLAAPKPMGALYQRAPLFGATREEAEKMVATMYNAGFLESRCPTCVPGVTAKGHRWWLEFYLSDAAITHLLTKKKFAHFKQDQRLHRALMEELHVIEGAHGPTAEHFGRTLDFFQGVPGV